MSTPTSSQHFQQQGPAPPPEQNTTSQHSSRVKVVAGYALQQRLGAGSFATVYKGYKVSNEDDNDASSSVVAIKAISRNSEKLTRKVLDNLELEISILRTYRHPNIVCLHDVQKTDRHFYLILEYCGGGDLQRLIRTRKNGRLSERLTRRLLRDLSSGLHFLWGQELIHRDIKPQNLLLTGPLPLDEVNDPAKMEAHEMERQQANFPSSQFSLKIADFGFARYLQTTSLAETLCGSPLYMAPEILQHQRYDAKADLWSVGTVLFEMISGRPPFNGENHIDLLRNIQRKAVRLPPDVRVSKECVTLLRVLLNRNPLSRAGFKEFFEACEAFVALGCEGTALSSSTEGASQPAVKMDLGTIHEADADDSPHHGAESMMTTATAMQPSPQRNTRSSTSTKSEPTPARASAPTPGFVTPPFGPLSNPTPPFSSPPTELTSVHQVYSRGEYRTFAPLEPSPPSTPQTLHFAASKVPSLPVLEEGGGRGLDQKGSPSSAPRVQYVSPADATAQYGGGGGRTDSLVQVSSAEDSGYIMVEHGRSDSNSSSALVMSGTDSYNRMRRDTRTSLSPSPPSSPRYPKGPLLTTRGEYLIVNEGMPRTLSKGMLSTSPGTGGALVGLMGGPGRPRLLNQSSSGSLKADNFDSQIETAAKTIATCEDVGRRAISVAHLGDTRAYLAMRLVACMIEEGPLLLSAHPMEGVEEEASGEQSSANVTDSDNSTASTARAAARTRQRSISTDRSMPDVAEAEDENEEMPFAVEVSPDPSSPPKDLTMSKIPTRSDASSLYRQSALSEQKAARADPGNIRSYFGEALACYLKALSMLKGMVNAVQRVRSDLSTSPPSLSADQKSQVKTLLRRCEVTSNWLAGQFTGVLERADAANGEIGKLPASHLSTSRNDALPVATVEELIYTHSLACGRDGAVKQLLGQYEAARQCYRTAGLLAETLLMESSVCDEDRRSLESYVDGFAQRITEIDQLLLTQSRIVSSSQGAASSIGASKRGSAVIGLIGGIPSSPSGLQPNPPFGL